MRDGFALKTTALLLAFIAACAFSGCKPPKKKGAAGAEGDVAEKVPVEFYIMSQCPFGTQVQQGIKPVLDKMGAYVDFHQDFIGNDLGGGKFNSMHGDNEVQGDMIQLCMAKHYPENYKYMDAAFCMANDMQGIPGNWKDCAAKAGLDTAKLQTCIDGEEGKALMAESLKRAQEARASGSPTIFIAGEKYTGGRTDKDFETAICCAFSAENKPAACPAQLDCPKRVIVDLTVLSDKRCQECEQRAEMMVRNFKDRFPKLNVTRLDYADQAGKDVYKKAQVQFLPAYIFDQNLKEDSGYAQIQRWIQPVGDYLVLMTGSKFDPSKEICDNGSDDTGNGLVDCDDDDCKGQLVCREETAGALDLFVMSQCPFGTLSVDAMKEVVDNFKGDIKFGLHFIVDYMNEEDWNKLPPMRKTRCVKKGDDMYYCSLHGEDELNEDLRQVCAMKYYGKGYKYMDYILCRNQDLKNPDWQACATKAKLDPARIEKCSTTDEGLALVRADSDLTKTLGFSGSPSWLGNNKEKLLVRDRTPEGIKVEFCKLNKDLAGCANTLTSAPPEGKKASPGSCG
jgi:2-hydroxychromene-2-carboxylate isomerase